ncbi:ABC transporter ATP-binding protein [Mangrovicoccus sp. HB161399]|uniref:ABC transporter ATP-binding protein n=1 Tax=Mangrovicoccus sp. HB161399 TaxID=2720392 RepID=UPI001551ACC9|nr:ABC transporter ATP-binding protein [Mangrovicoccus sp. HB161399]
MYIKLEAISKAYGGLWAVDRISMDIGRDEFISLLGPSGSGKTTLLRTIAGLERPTRGRVLIDGADVTALPPHRRGVAMVFQEFLLFPHRTVAENLCFPLQMMKMPRAEIAERLKWIAGLMALTGLEDRYPSQLSGGQQQRVALGRGLVGRPKALLLDEPLANLDRELRQEMEVEIRRHQRELGIPFIYVTHNQEEAMSMSDRIAVIRGGRVEDFAGRAAIYDRPRTAFIAQFIGRSNRFEGTVSPDGSAMDAGGGLRLALVPGARTASFAGSRAQAYIKTEKMSVQPNTVTCRIRDIILRGAYCDYLLDAGGREIFASRPRSEADLARGDRVTVSWPAEAVDIFEPDTPRELAA